MTPQPAQATGLPPLLDEQFRLDPAGNTMGVRFAGVTDGTEIAFTQNVTDWQLDLRGSVGPSTLGVLIDVAGGAGVYLHRPESAYVVSRLSASFTPWHDAARDALATASSVAVDDVTGTALNVGRIVSGGHTLGVMHCRCVRADRPPMSDHTRDASPAGLPTPPDRSSLVAALGLGRPSHENREDRLFIPWSIPDWTLNSLGTAQGGSLFSATAGVADIIGESLRTGPVIDYSITDLSVELMRSPVPEASPHLFTAHIIRRGRRLVVMTIELRDPHGKLHAHGTATVVLRTGELG